MGAQAGKNGASHTGPRRRKAVPFFFGLAASLAGRLAGALRAEAQSWQGVLWLPVAMALGAAVWFNLERTPPLLPIGFALATAAGWAAIRNHGGDRAAAMLLAGFFAGMFAADHETRRVATILIDGAVTTRVEGTVTDRDVDYRGNWRYAIEVGRTSDPRLARPPRTVRLVARTEHPPVPVGGRIAGRVRLGPPSGPVLPGNFDFAFNSYFQGVGSHGFFYGAPESFNSSEKPPATSLRRLRMGLVEARETIAARIRAALPNEAGEFAVALTVAERRGLTPATVEALRASGLAHILAISGLHMALVAGTFFVLTRFGFSLFAGVAQAVPVKKIAAAGALAAAFLYLFVSGASVSTQRAWIMLTIVLVAVLADRPALTLRNIALAAIVIIAISPSAVVGPGFQMSFAATAALITVYGLWNRARQDRPEAFGPVRAVAVFFLGLAVTSLVAGVATAPFAVHHFHRVAVYGLIANVLAMPVVTFLVMPFGLVAMIAMPFGLEYWPLVAMGKGLEWVVAIAHAVHGLGGLLVIGRIGAMTFATLAAGLTVFVLARTRLRFAGLAVAATSGMAVALAGVDAPEVLISEDGRLVALVRDDALASNRARPSRFILDQWRRALAISNHRGPVEVAAPEDGRPANLSAVWRGLDGAMPIFHCIKGAWCAGLTRSGQRVAVVEDGAFLGAACDHAGLVVTARRIRMERCRSGALLVTGRQLRRTGSLELVVDEAGAWTVRSAVGRTARPWTVQRGYDWRSDSFDMSLPHWAR